MVGQTGQLFCFKYTYFKETWLVFSVKRIKLLSNTIFKSCNARYTSKVSFLNGKNFKLGFTTRMPKKNFALQKPSDRGPRFESSLGPPMALRRPWFYPLSNRTDKDLQLLMETDSDTQTEISVQT